MNAAIEFLPPRLARLALAVLLAASAMAQDTRVILLGTGNPNPEPDRMGPAVAIVSAGRRLPDRLRPRRGAPGQAGGT
jgi:hypothetical protein